MLLIFLMLHHVTEVHILHFTYAVPRDNTIFRTWVVPTRPTKKLTAIVFCNKSKTVCLLLMVGEWRIMSFYIKLLLITNSLYKIIINYKLFI
jgi:hypothetical protein